MIRFAHLIPVFVLLSVGSAAAFEQPPITSPQDKACRDEAAGKVFDTPDPQGLGPHEIGKTIYYACMAKAEAAAKAPVKTARRARSAA